MIETGNSEHNVLVLVLENLLLPIIENPVKELDLEEFFKMELQRLQQEIL